MTLSSHRLRVEEKRFYRRLIGSLGLLVGLFVLLIFVGLPFLANIIIFFSPSNRNILTTNDTSSINISAPILDPTFEATNSATVSISGVTDKELTVKIFVNGKQQTKVLADKDGKFIVNRVKLAEGENSITAISTKVDKDSVQSSPLTITYKKSDPKLDISTPSDGQHFLSDQKEITISGQTDPGNSIYVNDRLAIVDQQGNFSYKTKLSDGDTTFKIIAKDSAGNMTTIERKVTYTP